nr:MAG TPA: hypothetical protein [Caudoviricetes sp.]DAY73213.1 MAG TPA: hypothetical protein [Caudoviricetes sp.]
MANISIGGVYGIASSIVPSCSSSTTFHNDAVSRPGFPKQIVTLIFFSFLHRQVIR